MHRHRRPFSGAAIDAAGPAGEAGTVADILEAEAAGEGGGTFGVEALPVIADPDAELFGVPGEADVDIGGRGVFEAILETFLDNTEQDQLFFLLYLFFFPFGGDGDFEAAGLADALHFFIDRFADAEMADMAGVEAFGETAEILQCAGDIEVDILDEAVIDRVVLLEAAELDLGEA